MCQSRGARYPPCFFFFFQAEDGIRDLTVTGVQTCALPIYDLRVARQAEPGAGAEAIGPSPALEESGVAVVNALDPRAGGEPPPRHVRRPPCVGSEKRRVGKEGRSRGVAVHLKKKDETRH